MIAQLQRYAATSPASGGHLGRCAGPWGRAMDSRAEFFAALQAAGVAPARASELVADGTLHRHRVQGDRPGTANGWHILRLDAPASGAGGSWRTEAAVRWCSKSQRQLSASERRALAERARQEQAQRLIETYRQHKAAAERAAELWAKAKPANKGHPYLVRKGIAAGIARQYHGALALPVLTPAWQLASLQFIDEQGSKRFLSGGLKKACFIPINGKPEAGKRLMLSEGWATGSTLAGLYPGAVVLAACDAGNLLAASQETRKHWPGAELIIAGDFDAVGQAKALQAAKETGAKILPVPELPQGFTGTDWNDWQAFCRGVRHVA